MSTPPALADRTALRLHRARAERHSQPAFFLIEEAIGEVQERLASVNRTFRDLVVVTPFAAPWQAALPQARVIADDEVLDLAPGTQDAVIHAMALHWADDPVGQILQCHRALRPDGLFLGLFPGGMTLHELRASLAEAEAEITGGLSPRVLPMAELRDAGGLLQRAGLALPVADSITIATSYRDIIHLARDLRAMGETNALAARRRIAASRALFARAGAIYAEAFPAGGGRIRATWEILCLTGWSPHESQQKPLRPGSARASLASALRTDEHRLP